MTIKEKPTSHLHLHYLEAVPPIDQLCLWELPCAQEQVDRGDVVAAATPTFAVAGVPIRGLTPR